MFDNYLFECRAKKSTVIRSRNDSLSLELHPSIQRHRGRQGEKESDEFMHKLAESSEITLRTRQEALDRDKEPYRGTPHARVCIPGTTNTATAGGRPGTRRVSQSQYLGQGQKVPRSPPFSPRLAPRDTQSRSHGERALHFHFARSARVHS